MWVQEMVLGQTNPVSFPSPHISEEEEDSFNVHICICCDFSQPNTWTKLDQKFTMKLPSKRCPCHILHMFHSQLDILMFGSGRQSKWYMCTSQMDHCEL